LEWDQSVLTEAAASKLLEPRPVPADGRPALVVTRFEDDPTARTTYPWPSRLLSWLIVALVMPLLLAPLAQRGLDRQSNALNLLMLLGLTACAGLAAFGLLGCHLDTGLAAVWLVLGITLSLLYNWLILGKLDDLRG